LSIALAVSLLIFLYVHNEYQYGQHLKNKDRIYRIETGWAELPSMVGHAISQEPGMIDKVVRLNVRDYTLNWKNHAIKLTSAVLADTTFFSIFDFEFIAGNPLDALKKPNSMVLTESYARKVFGHKNPINELIFLEHKYPFIITAIIKDPKYFSIPINAIGTISSLREMNYKEVLEQYDGWDYATYLLAKPGYTKDTLNAYVDRVLRKYGYNSYVYNTEKPFRLTNIKNLYFSDPLEYEGAVLHGSKQSLYILITIAVFILILAAINFINLTTSKGFARAKEVGIRKASGSTRKQLIFQFILETIIVVLAALFLAFLFIESVSPLFCNIIGKKIDVHFLYSISLIAKVVFLATTFGIVVGLSPALVLSSFKPLTVLKGKLLSKSRISIFQESLIVFQLLISIALIASTIQIYNQLKFMNTTELGFQKDHLIFIKLSPDIQLDAFKEEMLKIPGVVKASYSREYPGKEWTNFGSITIDGQTHFYKVNSVDPDYFETLGIEITEGRSFSSDIPSDYNSTILVNETAVKSYQLGNVIGKFATQLGNGTDATVIGIIKDFHYRSLHYAVKPVVFYFDKSAYNFINLKIYSKNIQATISKIENLFSSMSPAFPFEYHFLDEAFEQQYKSDERFAKLISYAAILAIIIACLGILGLAVFSAENRTKEIGIRKVNGATIPEIMILLSTNFTKWTIIAFVLACPIGYFALDKWLESFAYRTEIKLWVFILAGLIALIISLATVVWQSWRAANRNPVDALRYE
jgi:putative ABC transport system permease protein